ncbi:hypothetical protein BDD12DRAFT_899674 [Trichophaea hybrida]|nr:hypothetical protein BDD12DRAFT_899674 [Trichophaea hybrida]
MVTPQQTGCYKCGALDHIATNRNCPRPRKPQRSPLRHHHRRCRCSHLAFSGSRPRRKVHQRRRLGDDTRFWFYTDDDENEERSSSVEIIVKREEKSEDRVQHGEDAKNKWKMSDPVLKAAFAVKPVAPQKKAAAKKPEKKQKGVAKSVVRKKPVAKPVAKPRKPNATANAAGASKQTKPPGNPAKATKPDQPQSSSPLTDPPPSPAKQEETKPVSSGILGLLTAWSSRRNIWIGVIALKMIHLPDKTGKICSSTTWANVILSPNLAGLDIRGTCRGGGM